MIKVLAILTHCVIQLKAASKLSLIPSLYMFVAYYTNLFVESNIYKARPTLVTKVFDWYINNNDYIFIVLLMIILAHFLGTWKYLKLRKFNIKKNIIGFFVMLIIALIGAFIFEAMNIIVHRESAIKDYLVIVTRLIVFLYPARSAWKSMYVISNGKFPLKSWTEKLDSFEENLDIDVFKNPRNKRYRNNDNRYNDDNDYNNEQDNDEYYYDINGRTKEENNENEIDNYENKG